VQLLFAEALVLTGTGCGLGIGLAFLVPKSLASLDPAALPGLTAATVDGRLLAFVILLFAFVVALFSCVPVVEAFRARDASAMDRAVGRSVRSAYAGRLLAAMQIGLASIALVSTLLLVRTVVNLQHVPSGVSPAGVLTFRVTLPPAYRTGDDAIGSDDRAPERMKRSLSAARWISRTRRRCRRLLRGRLPACGRSGLAP